VNGNNFVIVFICTKGKERKGEEAEKAFAGDSQTIGNYFL